MNTLSNNKILIIISGESFKSGGSNNRNRGGNDKHNEQQKVACESHNRLFEYIESNFKLKCEIFINSYECNGLEKKLLSWYGDKVIYSNFNTGNFPDEFAFIDNTINNLKNINFDKYEYCLFLRPDIYLKNYFKETLIFDDKVRYAYVDSNPIAEDFSEYFTHYACVLHSITMVPKRFFKFIFEKKIWYWHSSASKFVEILGINPSEVENYVDLFIDTVHWSSTDLEWNPIFTQCGRFNTLKYEQCHEIQEGIPLYKWVYASKGIFYDKKNMKKKLSSNCSRYNKLRETELTDNKDINIFYE
jgi:hypothetical protein